MDLTINTDGGSRGNPGPAASAFVVTDPQGSILHKESIFLGKATNNEAEYNAVLLAYQWLAKHPQASALSVKFILDSELVVKQLLGQYKIKSQSLMPLVLKIKEHEKKVNKISYTHVRRAHNSAADLLVNQCLDEHKDFQA